MPMESCRTNAAVQSRCMQLFAARSIAVASSFARRMLTISVAPRFAAIAIPAMCAGRAQPAMLQTIEVDYYGAPTPLQSLATITAPSADTLLVNVFDKSSMDVIEKAILSSNMGFNPSNDGKVIRINVPQLTEERRKEMAKVCCRPRRCSCRVCGIMCLEGPVCAVCISSRCAAMHSAIARTNACSNRRWLLWRRL